MILTSASIILVLDFVTVIIVVLSLDNIPSSYSLDVRNSVGNSTLYFGCEEYAKKMQCERMHSKFQTFRIKSNSSTLYEATDNPVFVEGKHRKALQMQANHLKSMIFSNTSGILAKEFSIAFWVRPTDLRDNTQSPSVGHVISQFNTEVNAGWAFNAMEMQDANESVRFIVFNSQGNEFSTPSVPIHHGNKFVHIVGIFDGSSVKVYKDGELFGKVKFRGTYDSQINIPLTLGVSSGIPLQHYWTGRIDDLMYYDRAVSAEEVHEIFNDNNIEADGLIGFWKFDGNLRDISGNKHHGKERTLISSMAFAPDGRLFFSEKDTGHIKVMKDNKVDPTPFVTINDYYSNWEQGLLGLAIDPDFVNNHFVYLFYSSLDENANGPINRIVRFTDVNGQAKNKAVILDNIPASRGYHSGGAMAFGTDGKLYVTIGDATRNVKCGNLPETTGSICPAQDPSSLLGKILRLNSDGSIPTDNPFPNSPIYTIGHRNMYGIAFDEKGLGLVSENGASLYDEINALEKGANYGSPTFQRQDMNPELSSNSSKPLRSYFLANCLTQVIYYDGNKMSHLKNKFLAGTMRRGSIYALEVDKIGGKVIGEESISLNNSPDYQAISLAQSPDGEIYYGGYTLNKLEFVNNSSKSQILFPIAVDYFPANLNISKISYLPSNNELRINIESNYDAIPNYHNGENSNSSFTINIPNRLLDGVADVATSIDGHKLSPSGVMKYSVHKDTSTNSTNINMSIKNNIDYQISILENS